MATAVGNETVKGLRHGWGERLQILIELPLFVIFVLLLGYTVGQGEAIAETGRVDWALDPRHMTWLFVGLAIFVYTYLHLQKMFWRLLAEIQSGTLEQTYLSPLPSWVHVVGGRVLAAIAETAIVVAVMFAVTSLMVRLELNWRLDALVPVALLILGAAGLALMIAGITLIWKRIQMLNDLVLLAVFFFSGAVLPRAEMPAWAEAVGTPLFMTHAVAGVRTVMLDGHSLAWGGTGGLGWMVGSAAAWFVAGLAVFRVCERLAMRQGSLSHF
ncbi:MAG TPA: ABC transporter permease [Actinomycetota bacterium]|jgi:ABC-type polysaccharide/polyol phosphate export permease|nr:ABC transporter permease [Actinomycetota bacterium]